MTRHSYVHVKSPCAPAPARDQAQTSHSLEASNFQCSRFRSRPNQISTTPHGHTHKQCRGGEKGGPLRALEHSSSRFLFCRLTHVCGFLLVGAKSLRLPSDARHMSPPATQHPWRHPRGAGGALKDQREAARGDPACVMYWP